MSVLLNTDSIRNEQYGIISVTVRNLVTLIQVVAVFGIFFLKFTVSCIKKIRFAFHHTTQFFTDNSLPIIYIRCCFFSLLFLVGDKKTLWNLVFAPNFIVLYSPTLYTARFKSWLIRLLEYSSFSRIESIQNGKRKKNDYLLWWEQIWFLLFFSFRSEIIASNARN